MDYRKLAERFEGLTLESEDRWDYMGTSNSERDYVHGLCTYPAMMVPKMQREMLAVCLKEIKTLRPKLLDPFAGSGTVLVEGMLNGLDIVAIDINPLAVLLCKVKSTIIDINELEQKTEQLFKNIATYNESSIHCFKGIDKWFAPKAITDLSKIRTAIIQDNSLETRRFFWVTFCEVIRMVSNSRDCTYKLYIKDADDIRSFSKDTISLFKETLMLNINKYKEFYKVLKAKKFLKRDGSAYKGKVKVVLGDCFRYLLSSKTKFDLVFTSPPYGDNHTTVSYGQYSVLALRWIDSKDIDDNIDPKLFETYYEIDKNSFGGLSSSKSITSERKNVASKSETLSKQISSVTMQAPNQVNKLIAFYSDFDRFLEVLSRKISPSGISVWVLGNRRVARQEIFMNKIVAELADNYDFDFVTSFTRRIINKRMPTVSAYTGEGANSVETMTREHIQIFSKRKAYE